MAKVDIPKLVRSLRDKNDWSQEALSRELGISFSTVNAWERGKREPHPYLLKRLQELETTLKKIKK